MTQRGKIITPGGGRFGAKQHFYYHIAEQAFVECAGLATQSRLAGAAIESGSDEDHAVVQLENRRSAASVRCIVFAGMCLEAAIYDYAAWHLPKLVVDGLDKVDFLTKWRMIPLLVAKYQIPAGQMTYNALKELQALRNRLVHAKSERMAAGEALEAQLIRLAKEDDAIVRGYCVAMEAIILTSIEMDLHASKTINPLPHFVPSREGGVRYLDPYHPRELASLIARCRKSLGYN